MPGSIPGGTAKIKGLLAQLARAPALHAGGREFESLTVHKKNSVVEESGLSHLLWEQRHAGSNPVYATIVFYYQRVFIGMVLLEGRKEDLYNKYKGQIESERKLNSLFQPLSIYDMLIDEPFIQQTNYKYLDSLIQQYYFYNDIYPRQGKELEELEPNQVNTSIRAVSDMRQFVAEIVPKVQFFDTNKDKYPKKDLREYIGELFERDFLNFTNELIKQTSEKQEEKKARKEVDKVYDSDTILIVKPKTHTASCYYGAGTKWCTTMKNNSSYFESHTKNANLYYIIVKKKNVSDRFYKIAVNIKPGEKLIDSDWYDVQDNKFNFSEKDLFLTIIPQKAVDAIYDDLKSLKDSWFTTELIPQIGEARLRQDVKRIYLSSTKSIIIALRFDDFSTSDYLGDSDGDDSNPFQRFEFQFRMSEFNQNAQSLVDPEFDSTFYESGFGYGTLRISDNGQDYEMMIEFESNDEYDNRFTDYNNLDYPILEFPKIKHFSNAVGDYMTTVFNRIVDTDYFKQKLENYKDDKNIVKKYTMAGYTFTKGGKLTKSLMNYIESLPEGGIGNKLDFLTKTGQVKVTPEGVISKTGREITLQGYLSSFFSAAKLAGIIQKPEGKNGFIKGPNFNKYKEKIS